MVFKLKTNCREMKFRICTLLIALFLATSCGGKKDEITSHMSSTGTLQKSGFVSKNACDAIANIELESVLDWPAYETSKNEEHFDGKFSVCTLKYNDSQLRIRLAWKSDVSQNSNVLSNDYKKWTTEGDNGMVYSEVETTDDYEIIYTTRVDPSTRQNVYVGRKRFGNDAEVHVEMMTSDYQGEDAQQKVMQLISKVR